MGAELVANDREIGELTGRMAAMERTAERLEQKLDENSETTSEILRRFDRLDGGWKTLIAVGTVAAAIGGAIVKFVPMVLHP